MTTEADVNRIFRKEHNKAAVDKVCRYFSLGIVAGFWLLLCYLCIVEWTR